MPDSQQDLKKTWARVVAKAWADEEFKRRLLADPVAVAREEGVPVPEGLTLKVVEDTPGTRTLVLPPIPAGLGPIVAREEILAAGGNGGDVGDIFYCDGGGCFST